MLDCEIKQTYQRKKDFCAVCVRALSDDDQSEVLYEMTLENVQLSSISWILFFW